MVARLRPDSDEPWKWIKEQEAMQLLGIKSKSTMQEYRNDGKVRYSQPSRKVILYDRDSILELIQKSIRMIREKEKNRDLSRELDADSGLSIST